MLANMQLPQSPSHFTLHLPLVPIPAGNFLESSLQLNLPQGQPLEGENSFVFLTFYGVEEVDWQQQVMHDNGETYEWKNYSKREVIVREKTKINLWEFKRLHTGTYLFSFRFRLPEWLPGTLHYRLNGNQKVSVTYYNNASLRNYRHI